MRFIIVIAVCLFGAAYAARLGGWTDLDANNEMVQNLASVATEHRNSQIDSLYYRNLVEVTSARQQVVNGLKYEVTVVLGETYCARQDAGAKLCEVSANGIKEECVYIFWNEPAEENVNILSSSCTTL